MKSRFLASALICCAIVLSACATPKKMAFHEETDRSADQAQPVFLMTVTLKNSYKTSYQPKLLVVHVEKEGAKDSSERIDFTIDDKAKQETDSADRGNSYLLRLELDPGLYQIVGFTSLAGSFPIRGIFFAPLLAPLESNGVGVYQGLGTRLS